MAPTALGDSGANGAAPQSAVAALAGKLSATVLGTKAAGAAVAAAAAAPLAKTHGEAQGSKSIMKMESDYGAHK
jgi:hypothetical protein